MKKGYAVSLLLLLFSLFVFTPVAAEDYGVVYDETGLLGSQALTEQGEETLPMLSEVLGLDLRVDVLTQISEDSIESTAAGIYDTYGYGYGSQKDGVSLTILLESQDGEHYAMPDSNGWCIYVRMDEARGDSQALSDAVEEAVQPYMAQQAWNGKDMKKSANALAVAVNAMGQAVADYMFTYCPPDICGNIEVPKEDLIEVEHVFDDSDLLSYEEWTELEERAKALSQRHHFGIYFAMVDDYTEYGDGSVFQTTYQLYHENQLGVGEGRDGIIVLLSMLERDYAMFVYGEYAEYAFDSYGQEQLEETFLGDFGNDDWYGGITHYLEACDEFLTKAEAGKPVRPSHLPQILIAIGISCLVAGGICLSFLSRMKTVYQKTKADEYLSSEGLSLSDQYDRYTHTTETRTKIERESSGSTGSTSSESGGGGSGRSGKF